MQAYKEDSVEFDEIEHSDDWPDATTREPELEPDAAGLEFLAQLEAQLNASFDSADEAAKNGGVS